MTRFLSKTERGLSLMEVMIAMIAMGILMVAFTTIFQMLVRVWIAGTGGIDISQNLSVASARMGAELRSAMPRYEHDRNELNFVGIDAGGTDADMVDIGTTSVKDELGFHLPHYHANEAATNYGSEIIRILYWLKNDNGKTRIQRLNGTPEGSITLTAEGLHNKTGNTTDYDTIPALTLGTGSGSNSPFAYQVTDLQFEYRDSANVWFNSWNAKTKGELPELVRITMTGDNGQTSRTRVVIARPGATARKINWPW